MNSKLKKFTVPLSILTFMLVAYGLQLRQLGFYWDDWVFVYRYRVEGLLNTIFYKGSRQLGAYALAPGFLLAGPSVLRWHIYALLLRWVLTLAMRWNLRLLWPQRGWQADLMALLFAVYPAFKQHSIAVTYATHYMVYLWFFLSMGWMVLANRSEKRFWLYTVLALVTQTMHLFSFEYFFGLEWLRLMVLWLVLNNSLLPVDTERLKLALKRYLPFFAILVVYILWRSGVLMGASFQNYGYETFFTAFAADPMLALANATGRALRDLIYVLISSWFQTLSPNIIDLGEVFDLGVFGVAIAVTIVVAWVWLKQGRDNEENGKSHGLKDVLIFGALATILAFLPTWYAGREIDVGQYADRYSLAALFGASVLLVAVIEWLAGEDRWRTVAVTFLLAGLAAGFQARLTNDYRWDWTQQLRAYWNLYWRAPSIEPDTTIITNGNISPHVDGYVMIFALNELYQTEPENGRLPLWVDRYSTSPLIKKQRQFQEEDQFYKRHSGGYEMQIAYPRTLSVYYDYGECLQVLDAEDAGNKSVTSAFRRAAYISNLERIRVGDPGILPPPQVFGAEPEKNWCYFYEKAESAALAGEWGDVTALLQQAEQLGLGSDQPAEYLSFIKGYLQQEQWQPAADLSIQVNKKDPSTIRIQICALWSEFAENLAEDVAFQSVFEDVGEQVSCP